MLTTRYNNKWTIIVMFLAGACIRYWISSSRYQSIIANHIEVSTPLNSWKRVLEGLYLQKNGINPYNGDLLHETPLSMLLYKQLIDYNGQLPIEISFIIIDLLTSCLLYLVTQQYMLLLYVKQEENKKNYAKNIQEYYLNSLNFINSPFYVCAAFLFNPYTIFNCVGLSTMVIHNFFITLFLYGLVNGNVIVATLPLVYCTLIAFYPIILIIPLLMSFIMFYQNRLKVFLCLFVYSIGLIVLTSISYQLNDGNFHYLNNVYGFILTVPDLQPNIGLFWYFFTEMFDHFRNLFIYSFQINATILYLIPLTIKFRNDPFLLTFALIFLTTIFKSYPCLGDIGYILSLLPCFLHLFQFSFHGFLVGCICLITTILGPILWYLWIYLNSANANFYFGVTLAFAIAQIFLITDVLFASLKRDFALMHGKDRKIDGKDALLILE